MAVDYTGSDYGDSFEQQSPMIMRSKKFSADDNNVDVSATGALELISIPAGAWVHKVVINITTAETDAVNTVVLDIGCGDADGWAVDVDAESTGVSCDFDSAYHAAGGLYFATADTIDVTPSHDLDDIVFSLYAWYTPL